MQLKVACQQGCLIEQERSYSLAVGMRGTNVSLNAGCCRLAGYSATRTFKGRTGCLDEAARVKGQLGHLVNDRHDCLSRAIAADDRASRGASRKPGRWKQGNDGSKEEREGRGLKSKDVKDSQGGPMAMRADYNQAMTRRTGRVILSSVLS